MQRWQKLCVRISERLGVWLISSITLEQCITYGSKSFWIRQNTNTKGRMKFENEIASKYRDNGYSDCNMIIHYQIIIKSAQFYIEVTVDSNLVLSADYTVMLHWMQGSWGQHGAHLGPTGPRWAPCWPHELCYLGYDETYSQNHNFVIFPFYCSL